MQCRATHIAFLQSYDAPNHISKMKQESNQQSDNNILPIVYPGSFDPITNGHLDIIYRSLETFGKLTLAIGVNTKKIPYLSLEKRLEILRNLIISKNWENIVTAVFFHGLLSDFLKNKGIKIVVRGLRDLNDFEQEMRAMQFNRTLFSDFETVFFPSKEKYLFISSSLVREMVILGANVDKFVPEVVLKAINDQ